MQDLLNAFGTLEGLMWHNYVLYSILAIGILFTIWSGFGQYRAMTHGIAVVRGRYDNKDDPGAINHFQALSAALSATVGLGNIGGVAIAISLGGPGAVFWMWIVGFFGMAIKMTEVSMSMLYRNTEDPDNPHGGPMYVAEKGFQQFLPAMGRFGIFLAGVYVVTLLISTVTGGNMYQSWNVGQITREYFNVPPIVSGVILAVAVGLVIIGGIKRIGSVAGRIVPAMCGLYFLAAIVVLIMKIGVVPEMLALVVRSAFNPLESGGAFVGGTAGYAFMWGMKRALFSNEAGQGSAPIAHSAAKTDEPIREGVVAGLEPFIDTIVVCTLTALVILSSGIWNRTDSEGMLPDSTAIVAVGEADSGAWKIDSTELPDRRVGEWAVGDKTKIIVEAGAGEGLANADAGTNFISVSGEVKQKDQRDEGSKFMEWSEFESTGVPRFVVLGEGGVATDIDPEIGVPVFEDYQGAALTGKAFDRATNADVGKFLVTIAAWLFALSTMISWSYYGEQGVVYFFGDSAVASFLYKVIFCVLIILATTPLLPNDKAVGTLTGFGTGVMLFANVPIMLVFGAFTMRKYHEYFRKLKAGEFDASRHEAPSIVDVVEGKDVE